MTKKAYVAIIEEDYSVTSGIHRDIYYSFMTWARDPSVDKGTPYAFRYPCFRTSYSSYYYPKCTGRMLSRSGYIRQYEEALKNAEYTEKRIASGEKVYGPRLTSLGVFPLELFS